MVEFEDPEGASGSRVTAEVAADLREAPGRWAVIEEHPLALDGNTEQDAAVRALKEAPLPATAAQLLDYARTSGAGHQTLSLLGGVIKTDEKKAGDKRAKAAKAARKDNDEAGAREIEQSGLDINVYGSLSEVAASILAQQIKRIRARASSRTGVVKGGRGPFGPEGTFDSVQRTKDAEDGGRVVRVYAMFLGADAAGSAGGQAPAYPTPEA